MGMGLRRAVEVTVDQRPRVRPLVADVAAAALLAGVRDDPALGLPEAVDLHLGDVDPATGEGLGELRGPPRSAQPLVSITARTRIAGSMDLFTLTPVGLYMMSTLANVVVITVIGVASVVILVLALGLRKLWTQVFAT